MLEPLQLKEECFVLVGKASKKPRIIFPTPKVDKLVKWSLATFDG